MQNVDASGERYVVDEIEVHFAPEARSRFVRVTRPDGSTLFESGPPKDRSFDPSQLPPVQPSDRENLREARISGGYELVIYSSPCPSPLGGKFTIEAGEPDREAKEVLHGLLLVLSLALPVVIGLFLP